MKLRKLLYLPITAILTGMLMGTPVVSGLDLAPAQGTAQPSAGSIQSDSGILGTFSLTAPVYASETSDEQMRGLWVATVLNLDYPSKPGLDVETLKAEAVRILDSAAEMGFNTVVLQVRPSGDALYRSDIFPWSYYLTGNQGTAPAGGFDPLEFWVSQAHSRGLKLHAWVNPFRITRGTVSNPKQNLNNVAKTNPARLHPEWVVKYSDGSMYYNPGIPEVRSLIVSGVSELVKKYDIDGVHYDDYFYPAKDFPDEQTFKTYGAGYTNKDDWRRDNISRLIEDTYSAVKSVNADVRFGVSPVGIWANKKNNTYGSDTTGNESYYSHYADSRKWVKMDWLDYICPQIYWEIGYAPADYSKLVSWWADVVDGTGVDLYVGHAAYRCGSQQTGSAWQGTEELKRQFQLNAQISQIKGSVCFRYAFFRDYAPLGTFIRAWYGDTETDSVPAVTQLSVGRPQKNISTTLSQYYVLGASDPLKPLYVNGSPVENRTAKGYFGVLVKLKIGANTVTLTQGTSSVTRTITRTPVAAAKAAKMNRAEIIGGSAYPNVYDEYKLPGESVTLKCTAPIGAKVTAKLGGKTYTLKPAATTAPAGGLYPTTFSYTYTLPAVTSTGRVIRIGAPVYTMKYGTVTRSVTATGDVQCITPGAPYYAQVIDDTAFTYASNTTTGGPVGELVQGQKDYITAVTNGGTWVRLGKTGQWILRSQVKRTLGSAKLSGRISAAAYTHDEKWDKARFAVSEMTATKVYYDGAQLIFTLTNMTNTQKLVLPANSPFTGVTSKTANGCAVYTFTLKRADSIDGYYISTESGKITLNVKPRPKAAAGSKPLTGMTIVLDAGHGGTSSGALGPLGTGMTEKSIVLSAAGMMKTSLEALGAKVVMTRSTDVDVSLEQRLKLTRDTKPDLFISIHNNSADENMDMRSIRGMGSYYKNRVSKDFAEFIQTYLTGRLTVSKRTTYQSNLYVCRPYWTPAVLIETSFISNPSDFEWLIDQSAQKKLANTLAAGVAAYFNQ